MANPITLCFLRKLEPPESGSHLMRVRQLSSLMEKHGPDDVDVIVRPVATHNRVLRTLTIAALPKDVVFIVPKQVMWYWPAASFQALRKKGRAVLADYVDSNIDVMPPEFVDVHLSTSFVGTDGLARWIEATGSRGEARTLLHNVDARLRRQPPKQPDAAPNLIYVGSARSTHLPDDIRPQVDVIEGGTPAEFDAAQTALANAAAHYCIRPDPADAPNRKFKPFTKGFTAAWCGAAMVVNRSVDDAEAFLGEDYPFMCDTPDVPDIQNAIARLKDSWNGPDWAEAQDRGQAMAERVRPEQIARDLETIVREVLS